MKSPASEQVQGLAGIDAALRCELAGANGRPASALPVVSVVSAEHGPLVVMRADDLAVVLGYLKRRSLLEPTLS